MKKKFLVVSMFAALMLATSCSKDDSENNVEPQPVNTEVVNNATPLVVEKTYPITVKATKKTSVSKISLGDNGTDECFEIGDKLVLTWGADGSVELELIDGAGSTSATFSGEIPESANGQSITAHIGSPITAASRLGYASLTAAVHNCCYLVSNDFTYTAGEDIAPLTLDDQNSYLHFQLAETQTKFDLNIDGNTFTFSDFSNHEIWIAVPGGKKIKGNMISTEGKELESAKVYTVDRTDVVDLGLSVLWCTSNATEQAMKYTDACNNYKEADVQGYRLPTKSDFEELFTVGYSWDYTNKGCVFSNAFASVFFPAKGGILSSNTSTKYDVGDYCLYWSSTPTDKENIAYDMICSYKRNQMVGFAEHFYDWLITIRLVRSL